MCEEKLSKKKKEAEDKAIWVQLKCQLALPREAYNMKTDGKEPVLLEPISYEFTA